MNDVPQLTPETPTFRERVSQRISGLWQQIWAGKSGAAAMVQTFAVRIFILSVNTATGILSARFFRP